MNMTDILLAVSVGCNLWFLFLLLYDRIMETRFVRFLKGIAGWWRKYPLIPTLWMIFEDSTFAFRSGDKHRSRRIYGK